MKEMMSEFQRINKERQDDGLSVSSLSMFCEAWESQQSEIDSLKVENERLKEQLAKVESGEFVLVPREPSDKMIDGGEWKLKDLNEDVVSIYKAMIEAAQEDNQ